MEYAIQLLIPVVGGLMLGMWLTKTYGLAPIWTVVFAVLGMAAGIAVIARRFSSGQAQLPTYKSTEVHPPRPTSHVKDLDFLYKKYDDKGEDWKELDELDELDDDVSFDEPPGGYPIPPRPNKPEYHNPEKSEPYSEHHDV